MSLEFTCGDPAALAGYLYDECAADERAIIDAHVSTCVACGTELATLGATRRALASWTPPEAELGFRITSNRKDAPQPETAPLLRPKQWWQRPLPAWAQAAAALLIFAAGAGVGSRTAQETSPAAVQAVASTPASAAASVSARDLAALEQRLRGEMTAMRTSARETHPPVRPGESDATVQRVRTLLAESEQRQERQLALRLAQVMRDVDAQRRMDLVRIERTFGQIEGVTRPELAQQREAINYLIQRAGLQQRAPR
jgi:hypothetical protein